MRLSQEAALRQELALKLSPQMLQSIKLMELPLAELRERIAEELEKNPALEVVRDKTEIPLSRAQTKNRRRDGGDEHRQFIEGMLTRAETLQEHLLFQLRLQPVSAEVRRAGELIIQNLSGDGFHKEDIKVLFKDKNNAGIPESAVEAALRLVQSLDPPGCAARDYTESLSIQARILHGAQALEIESLFPHFEALLRGKISPVARALKIKESRVEELFALLKSLSPFPGRQFAEGAEAGSRFVIPELRVVRDYARDGENSGKNSGGGHFNIILNNETIPVLGLSPFFLENEKTNSSPPINGRHIDRRQPKGRNGGAERDFIRENLKEARWFLDAINSRNHTLLRVARAIVHFQQDFFEKGPRFLAPLTLSDVANKLDVHESTVSRAANGKYMETEWGIYEVRRFFTNAVGRDAAGKKGEGVEFSKAAVQEIVREIIKDEKRSLSDNEIMRILEERGIKLARRTIAKYRSQLGLDSSYSR